MGTGFGRRNPQEDNWDGNRGNDGQESHNGEQEVSQRGDQERGFDRWHNGSERGLVRGLERGLERGLRPLTSTARGEDFNRYATVRDKEEETKTGF